MRTGLAVVWTFLLAALTGFLGAVFIKALRVRMGVIGYFATSLALQLVAVSFGLYAIAIIIAAQTILIGIYSEFQEKGLTLRQSSFYAILITALLIGSSIGFWVMAVKSKALLLAKAGIQGILDKAASLNLSWMSQIKAEDILFQIPSMIVIFLIASLALGLVFERSALNWLGDKARRRSGLTDLYAPDLSVWLFIFALLGAFSNTGILAIEVVSINILNITVALFFFQGLSVLGKYFLVFHTGWVWRSILVFLLVFQVPILLALIGLSDYWIDFRKLLLRRAAELKKRVEE